MGRVDDIHRFHSPVHAIRDTFKAFFAFAFASRVQVVWVHREG